MPAAAGPVAGGRPSEPCRERGSRQYAQGEAKVARKNAPRALKGLLRPNLAGSGINLDRTQNLMGHRDLPPSP